MWSLNDISSATEGMARYDSSLKKFNDVVIDSRKAKPGSIFVAVVGKKCDGHDYLEEAVKNGAGCLVVHKPSMNYLEHADVVLVEDTTKALGDMARYHRRRKHLIVLAVTGSNGKTTTKDMLASILENASLDKESLRGKVLKTNKNQNNLIGVSLNLLRARDEKVAVLELGTSAPGEIARLTQITEPDFGIITSVGPAHLEGLRNMCGVLWEKTDLFLGLKPAGMAVVNWDDFHVRFSSAKLSGRKFMTYGHTGHMAYKNFRSLGVSGSQFDLCADGEKIGIHLKLLGEHNVRNATGAAVMAYAFGAGLEAIRKGLEDIEPVPMRMAPEFRSGIYFVNDAYNANPASMTAAFVTFAESADRARKIAVLGDMLELGEKSAVYHEEVGKKAVRCGMDRLYLLGEHAEDVKKGALLAEFDENKIFVAKDMVGLAEKIVEEVKEGDWVLLKGSRATGMERVLKYF